MRKERFWSLFTKKDNFFFFLILKPACNLSTFNLPPLSAAPCCPAVHHGPGAGVAPGALCLPDLWRGAGHHRLFRGGGAGLLPEGLPEPLLPSLWLLQGPDSAGASCALIINHVGCLATFIQNQIVRCLANQFSGTPKQFTFWLPPSSQHICTSYSMKLHKPFSVSPDPTRGCSWWSMLYAFFFLTESTI